MSLVFEDFSVCSNKKKLKYRYDTDQLEKIEELVNNYDGRAELTLEKKGERSVLFQVIDKEDDRMIFTDQFRR